ncbi:MAG: hypothetical protein JNL08_03840, partial [Planctomycetes bacterium]|nr:hypothetical protein [Planctomycetota bacterium]
MFTLQILDRGQSFLHSLDGSVVRIGSAADADLRLGEAGVLPQHARLEPAGDRVRLVASGPVRVNDRAVGDAELQLGDRIEIGRAVLVVGRAVTRRATADEVLDEAPARSRSRGARTATKRKVPWVPIGAAAIVLAAVGWIATQRDDTDGIRDGLAVVERLCDDGRLEDAAATLGRLRQEWAKAPGDPLRLVDAAQERLDAIHAEIARIEGQVRDPQIVRSYADWILELRRLEDGGQPIERVAARRVRATLRATYDQRPAGAVVADQVA